MKIRHILIFWALVTYATSALAQTPKAGVGYEYVFDNREFGRSDDDFASSMTLHFARLDPWAGVEMYQDDSTLHRVVAGASVLHNMGEDRKLSAEAVAYWNGLWKLDGGRSFEACAGIFPRSFSEGYQTEALLSDSLAKVDNNLEGMLLKWKGPRYDISLGLDWMGMFGQTRKERFQVFSNGSFKLGRRLYAGWCASLYHYASSAQAHGTCDNHLVEPWLMADFAYGTAFETLNLRLGYIQTIQRDRPRHNEELAKGYNPSDCKYLVTPGGIELVGEASRWNFGVRNTLYYGSSLTPFRALTDRGGNIYGSNLYRGSAFYSQSFYNLAEIWWQPHLAGFVDAKVSARFHFGNAGYLGCQQLAGVVFKI